jgi:hypothetical protein
VAAVSAAPTVPEWITARPVFGPSLIPLATMSGGGPKALRSAIRLMKAGDATTE